jgi:aryl-alcohol dehydrogenase-like predicted oxidoreductase/nucleoside-diphosphate-sugar epimerase
MKLLILGGTRFLGKELIKQAVSQYHDVTLISLDPPENQSTIEWLNVDRTKVEDMKNALEGKYFDAIIDNIAYNSMNVRVLLEAIQGRAKRYVLTSTVDTYQNKKLKKVDEVIDKNLTIEDVTGDNAYKRYSVNKRSAEITLRSDLTIKEKVILRPSVVMGTYDNVHQFDVPRSLIWPSKIIDNQPLLAYMNDCEVFSLAYVGDVAKAQLLLASHPDAANQVFNVVGDTVWTTETFVTKLAHYYGSKSKIVARVTVPQLAEAGVSPDNKTQLPRSWGAGRIHKYHLFDNSRLKKLGWKPTDEKTMLLSLFEDQAKIDEIREKFNDLRTKEIAYAKTLPQDNLEEFTKGYCQTDLSKVAIGTFRGEANEALDQMYYYSMKESILNGINVIDTAINYRTMRSEKIIGKLIKDLIEERKIHRSDVFVITKGGFVGNAYAWPIHTQTEIKHNHCIRPGYINHVFDTSYSNLKLQTIDMYFLHNPEIALQHTSQDDFYYMLLQNFVKFENEVFRGRIRSYGIATWEGLICDPSDTKYIDFSRVLDMVDIASNGKRHNFRGIELPLNVRTHAALTSKNQFYKGEWRTVLEIAKMNDIMVFTSASVLYGQDAADIDIHFNFQTDFTVPQKSLLFAKSLPEVTSAIANMRQIDHVTDAIKVNNHYNLTPIELKYTIDQCIFRKIK